MVCRLSPQVRPQKTRFWVWVAFATTLYFQSALVSFAASSDRADDPYWQQFVVGKVDSLPDGPVKSFLIDTHRNNPYAKKIATLTKALGPFAPEQDNVFWIPTIDVPVTKDNWRFLSTLNDIPDDIQALETVQKGGQTYLRMFLHPYSLNEPKFKAMAMENGGFKFEFQGTTTASTRSLIAWKTSTPKPADSTGTIDFPNDPNQFIWPKVSITKADIEGSRLNPAKKMARAYAVTRTMAQIPVETKKKIGFDFAGEWVVGVPKGTDAGYVVRQILPQYLGQKGDHVEPGFTVLSPKRLQELTKDQPDPEGWVRENLLRPLLRTVSYLYMEEGMIGEYHTQNFNYVMDRDGKPTKTILLHDADAFRTSITLRALEGKSTAVFRKIDAPFFFMKDSVFNQKDSAGSEYGINELIKTYITDAGDTSAVLGSIFSWCSKISAYKGWCTKAKLKKMGLETFSEELAPYLDGKIETLNLDGGDQEGKSGMAAIFQKRLAAVAAESNVAQSTPRPELQTLLYQEFTRLNNIGMGKKTAANVSMENSNFILIVDGESAFITAVAKKPGRSGRSINGIALLGMKGDSEAEKFAADVKIVSDITIPIGPDEATDSPARAWMSSISGGSNIPKSVRDYLKSKAVAPAPLSTDESLPRVTDEPVLAHLSDLNAAEQCVSHILSSAVTN